MEFAGPVTRYVISAIGRSPAAISASLRVSENSIFQSDRSFLVKDTATTAQPVAATPATSPRKSSANPDCSADAAQSVITGESAVDETGRSVVSIVKARAIGTAPFAAAASIAAKPSASTITTVPAIAADNDIRKKCGISYRACTAIVEQSCSESAAPFPAIEAIPGSHTPVPSIADGPKAAIGREGAVVHRHSAALIEDRATAADTARTRRTGKAESAAASAARTTARASRLVVRECAVEHFHHSIGCIVNRATKAHAAIAPVAAVISIARLATSSTISTIAAGGAIATESRPCNEQNAAIVKNGTTFPASAIITITTLAVNRAVAICSVAAQSQMIEKDAVLQNNHAAVIEYRASAPADTRN